MPEDPPLAEESLHPPSQRDTHFFVVLLPVPSCFSWMKPLGKIAEKKRNYSYFMMSNLF